jgi:hypothetical protein
MQALSTRVLAGFCGVMACAGIALGASGCNRDKDTSTPRAPRTMTDRAALLAGASGEAVQPNFFMEDLRGLQSSLLKRGWKVNVVAGSKDGELPGARRASNDNLADGVRRTLEGVSSGGQALLLFHSHGRLREVTWGQRSHSIVSEDHAPTGTDLGFDLDSIEPEILRARSRGVRVALVDLSCYSGSVQVLRGPACTISLAAAEYVSLCSGRAEERNFTSKFLELPSEPVSLEAHFLEARRQDIESINLPQISSRETPALAGWETYLKYADPLDTYEELKNLQVGVAAFEPGKLLGPVDQWIARQIAQAGAAAKATLRAELKALRAEIAQRLDAVLKLRKRLEADLKPLAKDHDEPSVVVELEGRGPLKLTRAALFDAMESLEKGIPESYSHAQRNFVMALKPHGEKVAALHGKALEEFEIRQYRFDQTAIEMARAAGALFESERKLYDAQAEREGAPDAPNGCRDFAL